MQYLKKEDREEVDFFADRVSYWSFLQVDLNTAHQSFIQGDTIIIDGHD